MAITRSLNLVLSLTGVNPFKRTLQQLQKDAIKLRDSLNNIPITINTGTNGNSSAFNDFDKSLGAQFLAPLNSTINGIKSKKSQLKSEIKDIPTALSYLTNINKQISSLINRRINLKISLTGDKEVKSQLFDIEKEIDRLNNKLKNLSIGKFKYGNSPNFDNITSISNTLSIPNTQSIKIPTSYNTLSSNYLQNGNNNLIKYNSIQTRVQQTLQNILQTQTRINKSYNDWTNNSNIKGSIEDLTDYSKIINSVSSSLIQTGFGLHIVQIYIAPLLYAFEQLSAKIISTYSEFDKLFTNYKVKSEEFGEYLSKGDFYSASIGQTFGISDSAKTAERFAASGIDVAKSQAALTSVMQVATAADMDYTEAANGVIQTLAAMHMQVQQTTEVTDALINSANASTAELSDLVSWFQYSASSAYQMRVNVQDLSAYLGILANTGTPQTGAAMRQLFLQLSKEDIQKTLKSKFSWITDKDLTDFNALIADMRTYVRSQGDQKAATLEITRLLGGKANAQQALNNLLMAEPEMWNNITNAVKQSGSTQDLYNKITDNAADSLKKIQVNLEIIFTQLGESVGPILSVVANIVTKITSAFIALPGPIKTAIGLIIFITTALAAITFTAIGVIGALAIMAGTVGKVAVNEELLTMVTQQWSLILKNLAKELYSIIFASSSFNTSIKTMTTSTETAAAATTVLTARQRILNSTMLGLTGGFIGYMASSSLMQKQMYTEAYIVGTLTALWLAYNAAKAASVLGPYAAVGAGVGTFVGYEALVYDQIETLKNNAFNSEMNKHLSGNTTNYKNTNINIANANLSTDGMNIDDLIEATDSDYELDD